MLTICWANWQQSGYFMQWRLASFIFYHLNKSVLQYILIILYTSVDLLYDARNQLKLLKCALWTSTSQGCAYFLFLFPQISWGFDNCTVVYFRWLKAAPLSKQRMKMKYLNTMLLRSALLLKHQQNVMPMDLRSKFSINLFVELHSLILVQCNGNSMFSLKFKKMITIKISSKIREHLFMTGLSLSTVSIYLTITIYICEKTKKNKESTLRGHASLFKHKYAYGRRYMWGLSGKVLPEGPSFTSWTSLVYCLPFVGRYYSRIALIPPIRHQKPLLAHA